MKIIVIQDVLRSGGTERQTILLMRAFLAAGHEALLLTFRPGGALAATASALPRLALQPFDLQLDWFAPGLSRTVVKHEPNVVLCMGRMANCHAGFVQEALKTSRPHAAVVATMRTGKPLPWLFRRSLRRVRHVVANSRDARETLIGRYHVPPQKISVIHNSLVFPAAASDTEVRASVRARCGATPDTTVLLCVGMFRPEKNQRELIEIAARLPRDRSWQLWFAGGGPELDACNALAAKLGIAKVVRFLGFQADPTQFYAAADVAVLTSRSESLSNFLIEAQAHGLPVVAYNAAGVGEAFVPGVSGTLVAFGDRTGFCAALTALAGDLQLRARQGEHGRSHARDAFAPERQAQAYLDLFRRLVNSPTS